VRTAAKVVAAATHVLASSPDATMQEIADAAGIGRATVYRHYATREDLLAAIERTAFAEVRVALEARDLDRGDPIEALHRALDAFFEVGDRYRFLAEHPEQPMPPADKQAAMQEVFAPVVALLDRARREGAIRSDVSAEWVRAVLGGLLRTAFEQMAAGAVDRDAAPALVARTLLEGLGTPPPSAGRGAPS
jgi:TetR/AcrR family transcriptional repressor of mexCD-oprJ operon